MSKQIEPDPVNEEIEVVRLTVRIPVLLLDRVRESARLHFRSVNQEIIESLVKNYVDGLPAILTGEKK